CKNDVYYGSLSDPYVIFMQILTTKKEGDKELADRIHITLLSTDSTKSPIDRMVRQTDKHGLFSALDFACIWLERALLEKQ
ncbi:MAG: hypothetical protein RSD78_04690, partial [Oscillospiraceae bacterium]